ncbi:MAG: PD40 domain-containing protein [Bacteroidetes bacterium]|nr:PD40 domain-containing protein [Bacteroidota bacterium]
MKPFSATAQTDSAKLFRNEFNSCEEWLKRGKYEKAISCLQSLSDIYPNQVKTYVRLAELFYNKRDNKNLLLNAKKAMDLNANDAYAPLTYLANKMMTTKDADLGLFILNRLATSDLDTIKQVKAEQNRMHHTLKSYADKTPVAGVHLRNMGDSINSKENEYLPSISLDGNTMVFTRNVGGNEDFFISNRDSNLVWNKAKNLGYPPNTGLPDGAAKLSADGNYLFYTRCDMRSPDGIRGGGCDIVFSYKEDGGWSAPQMFGYTINTTAYEGQPCLSSDNRMMYFVSNREGGYGGMDIWMSKFENNLWSKPENLGPNINTGKDETSPFIHPDNETLYFASNGHTGLGLSDLFISRKNSNGTWKLPINLGAPINTDKFDGSIIVNAKGTMGYCTSDRMDTKGGLDIYSFDLYPAIQPIPTVCLKGFVVDKFYKNHINKADIRFINSYNKLSVGDEKSNAGDGSYTKALQMGKRYLIHIDEKYYRPFYKYISLTNDTLSDNVYLNIKLKQPGLIDTLYTCNLMLDSTHSHFDSLSHNHIDTLLHHWDRYSEDSATVLVFLKSYYYSGDSLADSTYKKNIETCFAQMQLVAKQFEKKKLACQVIMYDPCMLILKDDEEPFQKVELTLLEYY